MKKSVCILGAGIGGLTAGAYLATYGYNVTVLEKATTVGGSAGWYVRKNRIFPTGATITFGLEEQGLLQNMLRELGINLPAEELSHPMDIILPDRKISLYKDHLCWEKELRRAFPDQSEEIMRFWHHLTQISEDVLSVTKTGVSLPIRKFYDLGTLPAYVVKHPLSTLRLAYYARWTVEDLLRKYGLEHNTPFRQLLNAQLIDAVQTDVSQAALLPSSLALAIYRKGSFHVENGIGQISNDLADKIVHAGGKVFVSSPVRAVTYNEMTKEWHVDSTKCASSFSIVINNTGTSFGPGTSYVKDEDFSWGAFRIDAIVKDDVWREALNSIKLPFAYQIVPDPASATLLGDEQGPIYVTFHKSIDNKGHIVSGEIIMTVSVHTNPKEWLSYSKDEYKSKKEQLVSVLLSEIEKVIPLKKHLIYLCAGTPLTYKKFVGKSEVGGFPLTVANAVGKPRSIRASVPQMYIVGEQVFPGPGTLSSALSGYYAARAIMKEM